MQWTVQQLTIFAWFCLEYTKALVVVARAGCGKSTTMVEGIKRYLAAAKQAGKRVRVLATSFAKLSVNDLAAKLADYSKAGCEVKTINSLGNSFCYGKVGKLDNDSRSINLAKHICGNAPDAVLWCVAKLNQKARALCMVEMPSGGFRLIENGTDIVELAERFDLGPDEDCIASGWDLTRVCNAAFDCMVCAGQFCHEYDYADQTFLPLWNGWVRAIYDRIIIDETQDLDPAQLALVMQCVKDVRGIVVVGDDMQAIYGFRGADIYALDRIERETGGYRLTLTMTRRCAKSIVRTAVGVMPDKLSDFTAAEDAPEGLVTNNYDIGMMLDSVKPGEFILSRTNAPLVSLCLALLRRKVRAYVAGRKVGETLKGIVSKCKAKSMEDLAAKLAKFTDKKLAKLQADPKASNPEWLAPRMQQAQDEHDAIMVCVADCTTINELLGRIDGLFAEVLYKCTSVTCSKHGAICGESDYAHKDCAKEAFTSDRVMLATCHKAKGLEADRVWLAAGTFKIRSHDDSMIKYVAITRAKSELHFVRGFETPGATEDQDHGCHGAPSELLISDQSVAA